MWKEDRVGEVRGLGGTLGKLAMVIPICCFLWLIPSNAERWLFIQHQGRYRRKYAVHNASSFCHSRQGICESAPGFSRDYGFDSKKVFRSNIQTFQPLAISTKNFTKSQYAEAATFKKIPSAFS